MHVTPTAILGGMHPTQPAPASTYPVELIAKVPNPRRRADAQVLAQLMEEASPEPATMWGPSIVGFGSYHYMHDSGREGDAPYWVLAKIVQRGPLRSLLRPRSPSLSWRSWANTSAARPVFMSTNSRSLTWRSWPSSPVRATGT